MTTLLPLRSYERLGTVFSLFGRVALQFTRPVNDISQLIHVGQESTRDRYTAISERYFIM
jgi:hypothetical protein